MRKVLPTFQGARPLLRLTRAGTLTSRNPLISSGDLADILLSSGLARVACKIDNHVHHNIATEGGSGFMLAVCVIPLSGLQNRKEGNLLRSPMLRRLQARWYGQDKSTF